ncbi:hypothetical protein GCM10025883_35120 [Mobilicoccus caccae]|uniref:Uncharacterized protein n=1 Tax=Mobilicoccus caccae TaxID=1859295 RepID=A0ABQ6IXJ9_9MICO|nr:hypothetical protein GCM10025883_35120 [Mobilicoccus caccae]
MRGGSRPSPRGDDGGGHVDGRDGEQGEGDDEEEGRELDEVPAEVGRGGVDGIDEGDEEVADAVPGGGVRAEAPQMPDRGGPHLGGHVPVEVAGRGTAEDRHGDPEEDGRGGRDEPGPWCTAGQRHAE